MDIDPNELVKSADDEASISGTQQKDSRAALLNTLVAITVAVLATFMGICKVKDDNIVQAMQQAQADKLDHWAYYQARTLRHDLAEATATQLKLTRNGHPPGDVASYDEAIARYERVAIEQATKRDELKKAAEDDQKRYDAENFRDDQFDLSDALLAIAIALLAVTALTRLWWLYWVAWVPIGFGVLMGLAGLLGWPVHPDALVRLLS